MTPRIFEVLFPIFFIIVRSFPFFYRAGGIGGESPRLAVAGKRGPSIKGKETRLDYAKTRRLAFAGKVIDESPSQSWAQFGRGATRSQHFPQAHALPDPPLPPFFKGGLGGDFRDGPAKHDFLAIFKIFDFGRRSDESRVFRKKPILKKRIFG